PANSCRALTGAHFQTSRPGDGTPVERDGLRFTFVGPDEVSSDVVTDVAIIARRDGPHERCQREVLHHLDGLWYEAKRDKALCARAAKGEHRSVPEDCRSHAQGRCASANAGETDRGIG